MTFDLIMGERSPAVLMRMFVYEGRISSGGIDGDGDVDAIAVVTNALMARKRVVDFIAMDWWDDSRPRLESCKNLVFWL